MSSDFSVRDNVKRIKDDIAELCVKYSRNVDEITLCAVSKTKSIECINAAADCGIRVFGENYVQEIQAKFATIKRNYKLRMIGHLQSNKVNKVLSLVDSIDSVDSVSLLRKINSASAALGRKTEVLLEINTSGDDSKTGFKNTDEYFEALSLVPTLANIDFRGLMTMGPVAGGESETHRAFESFMQIADKSKKMFPSFDFGIKSFGMSGDYRIAVETGSTMLRIGTAIFGSRSSSKT